MSLPEKPLLLSQGPPTTAVQPVLQVEYVLYTVHACRSARSRTEDTPAHNRPPRRLVKERYAVRPPMYRGYTPRKAMYHCTAHEAWHPEIHNTSGGPSLKTCISRIYTCTSTTIHMHSRKSTYACTHPAVPSVGSHRADGKASPHVTRTGQ